MSYYSGDTKIHYGYIVEDGCMVRLLLATSYEGLEAQARLLNARLCRADYCSVEDIDEFADEAIWQLEYELKLNEKRGVA